MFFALRSEGRNQWVGVVLVGWLSWQLGTKEEQEEQEEQQQEEERLK